MKGIISGNFNSYPYDISHFRRYYKFNQKEINCIFLYTNLKKHLLKLMNRCFKPIMD